jgi:4-amino-4-deoxy-L-arabinose transferase-like glycosyltransferase
MATTTSGGQQVSWRANGLRTVIDFAVASHARAVAVLAMAALLSFLPGQFSIPPIDRDEARFAQATKQMIESGDYVDIRFQDVARYKKPVGIYWLQTGPVIAVDKLGKRNALTTIGLYRLPSLIGAIGAVLLTYWVALAFVSRRAAVLAGLMMASAILLGVEARLAKTDAMLLATILAAMGTMARIYLGEHRIKPGLAGWTLPAVFWTALAAGILIKGPLILLFVGLTIATLLIADRAWRWLLLLRPLQGIVWLAVLVAPWFVTILSRSGDAFVAESVGQDLLPKIFGGQESHGFPPGLYFLLFWVTFWPAATLAGMAAPAVWASRREKGARFLLAWLVPSWIVFELVMTKLPHYVLPLYPAIAILIAGILDSHRLARKNWMMWGAAWWFVVPVVMVIGMIAGLVMFGRQLGVLAWPFAAGALVLGLQAWRLFDADGAERSLLRAIAASILMSIALFGVVLPAYPALFPSVPLSRYMRAVGCENPVAAAAGFHEPSLVYLAGTSTRLLDGTGAADFLRPGGCRFAFVEARHERSFLRRADAIGLRYFPGPRIDGYNISTGRSVSIAIYRADTGR